MLIYGDMFNEIPKLPEESIDLIFADLPYSVSKNFWDKEINLTEMWRIFNYIMRKGAYAIFTSSGIFTGKMIMSNTDWYKYTDIWIKTIASGQLNIGKMPLRKHEEILVFRKPGNNIVYNEIITQGKPYIIKRNIKIQNGYGEQREHTCENTGTRRQTSIFEISNPRTKNGHPSQKPYQLIERIIYNFSNENDTVLDPCFGSNVTGKVCYNCNRKYIGIELNKEYYDLANKLDKNIL